jgi:hypothetical protein
MIIHKHIILYRWFSNTWFSKIRSLSLRNTMQTFTYFTLYRTRERFAIRIVLTACKLIAAFLTWYKDTSRIDIRSYDILLNYRNNLYDYVITKRVPSPYRDRPFAGSPRRAQSSLGFCNHARPVTSKVM